MILELTKQFSQNVIGIENIEWLLNLVSIQKWALTYWVPWACLVAGVLNTMVFILCMIIYMKTKRTNHKPAFVFIAFIAMWDGVKSWVYFSNSLQILRGVDTEHDNTVNRWEGGEIERCRFLQTMESFQINGMLHTLVILTVDRYFFIKRPLHYPLIMTKKRTWAYFILSLVLSILWGVVTYFSFEAPPENTNGLLCSILHNYPYWWEIGMCMAFFIITAAFMGIYSVMLYKFQKQRKKLKALQRITEEDDFAKSNMKLNQVKGVYKKRFLTDPSSSEDPVQTLSIKHLDTNKQFTSPDKIGHQRKRRNSSIVRAAAVLMSHVKATKYVLLIVGTHLISFFPAYAIIFGDTMNHMVNDATYKAYLNTDLNSTAIFNCMNLAIENTECNLALEIEEEDMARVEDRINSMFHIRAYQLFLHITGSYLSVTNAVLNPFFYAFWYPEFRKYVIMIPGWFIKKKLDQNSPEKNGLPPIVTVRI